MGADQFHGVDRMVWSLKAPGGAQVHTALVQASCQPRADPFFGLKINQLRINESDSGTHNFESIFHILTLLAGFYMRHIDSFGAKKNPPPQLDARLNSAVTAPCIQVVFAFGSPTC
jgi:hypothetical protein